MGWVSQRMIETYSHTRMATKMAAFGVLEKITPEEPTPAPAAVSLDLMNPAIQAEIARQVAIALQQEREQRYYPSPVKELAGPRLVTFPAKGNSHA